MPWIHWRRRSPLRGRNEALELLSCGGPPVVLNDRIYYFARRSPDYVSAFALNPCNLSWEECQAPGTLHPVTSPCVPFAHGHKVYLYMESHLSPTPLLHCFDTRWRCWSRVQMSGDYLTYKGILQACVVNETLFVFSEQCTEVLLAGGALDRGIHALDLSTMVWRALGGFWPPNCWPIKFVAFGDRLYVLLVEVGEGIEKMRFVYFDTITNSWVTPPRSTPTCRSSRVEGVDHAFVYDDYIYVILGNGRSLMPTALPSTHVVFHNKGPSRFVPTTTVLRYSVERNVWEYMRMTLPEEIVHISVVGTRVVFSSADDYSWQLSVLEMQLVSLRSLCLSAVARYRLSIAPLPPCLQKEVRKCIVYFDVNHYDDEEYKRYEKKEDEEVEKRDDDEVFFFGN